MTVVNLDTLNSALVPRVAPEESRELARARPGQGFISTRMDAGQGRGRRIQGDVVLESQDSGLKTTNRLEVVDAVENLRELAAVLDQEQGGPGSTRQVQKFEFATPARPRFWSSSRPSSA